MVQIRHAGETRKSRGRKIFYAEASMSDVNSELLSSEGDDHKEVGDGLSTKHCKKIGIRLKMVATGMVILGGMGLYLAGYQTMEHSQLSKKAGGIIGSKESILFISGWTLIVFSSYGLMKNEPLKSERVTSI